MNELDTRLKVGVEIVLAEAHLTQLTTTMILLEEIREKHPKEFDIAVRAIQEASNDPR